MYFDVLAEFAAQTPNPGVTAVAGRLRAPLEVAVLGRPGVGRGTVAAALAGTGMTLTTDSGRADLQVVVIAETLKPEDRAQLRAAPAAAMVVLNKADLTGAAPGGPLASAQRRAAEFAATLGLPVVPMIAHLAAVGLDDDEIAALRALADSPADMTSTDAFVQSSHPLPPEMRRRLLDRLDRFGVAHAVLALADGATGETVVRQLRALSGLDRVVEGLEAVAAPVRYRRVCAAMHELHTLAVQSGDERLAAFLTTDEVVLAMMSAAVDVVEASGLTVDRGDDVEAHLRRARHWRNYARGPVDATHRRCGTDIARGSLRLLGRAR